MSRTGFAPRERFLWTSARIATGALFVAAGLAKLFAPMATAEVVASRHMFSPATVGTAVALFEVVCGGLLIVAFHTRWVAMALGAFVAVATILFHFPITLAGPTALELGFDFALLVMLYALFAHARRPNGT